MPKYKTKQRTLLAEYLSRHPDQMLSAREIAADLAAEGVSVSAVYRNLAQMEGEGVVRRAGRAGSREAVFQYLEAEPCRHSLHMSCKQCGRTYHMDDRGAEELIRALTQNEHFALDRTETVLYGVCGTCRSVEK